MFQLIAGKCLRCANFLRKAGENVPSLLNGGHMKPAGVARGTPQHIITQTLAYTHGPRTNGTTNVVRRRGQSAKRLWIIPASTLSHARMSVGYSHTKMRSTYSFV